MRFVLAAGLLLGGFGLACASDEGARKSSDRQVRVLVQQDTRALEEWRQAQAQRLTEERRARAEAEKRARAAEEQAALREQEQREAQRREREAAQARLRAQEEAQRAAAIEAELNERQAALERQQQELREREAALAQAERARAEAEQRARKALEQVASVREEARGLVVTLSGSVLFPFDEAVLLPSARERLDVVAQALRETGSEQPFRIEGHTDAIGSEAYNIELSQRRAEAVRQYLVSRGVSPEQIQALGYGEVRPVASNASPEGRANNRRVEIVLPRQGVGGSGAAAETPPTP